MSESTFSASAISQRFDIAKEGVEELAGWIREQKEKYGYGMTGSSSNCLLHFDWPEDVDPDDENIEEMVDEIVYAVFENIL